MFRLSEPWLARSLVPLLAQRESGVEISTSKGEADRGGAKKESFFPAKEVVQKGKSKKHDCPRGYHENGTKKGNNQKAEAHLG